MKLKPFIALLGISYSLSYSAYADCAGLAFRLFRSSLPPSISSILLKSFPNHDKNVGIHKKQSYGTLLEKTALDMLLKVVISTRESELAFLLSFLVFLPSAAWAQFRTEIIPLTTAEDTVAYREQKEGVKISDRFSAWMAADTYTFKDGFFLSKLRGDEKSGTIGLDYQPNIDTRFGLYYKRQQIHSHTPPSIFTTKLLSNGDAVHPYVIYKFTPNFFAYVLGRYQYGTTKSLILYQPYSSFPPF